VTEDHGSGMRHIAMLAEYDGTEFVGLQRQDNGRSIQGEFERVAALLGAPQCEFRASGRTDAGVHARGQVIALNLPAAFPLERVLPAFNWHLPESIRVRRAVVAAPEFDPRRHAIRRTYRYHLAGGQPVPPMMRDRMGRARAALDLDRMRAASAEFLGDHDFRAWRSTMCQAKWTILTLDRLDVEPWPDRAPHGGDTQCFTITVACRSFLHRMVRYLVGGLIQCGRGHLRTDDLSRHLREATLPTGVAPADACGLSLERVEYPPARDPFAQTR